VSHGHVPERPPPQRRFCGRRRRERGERLRQAGSLVARARPPRSSFGCWRRSGRAAELDTLRERCATVERQVEGLEALGARLAAAEQQAERLTNAAEDIDRIQGRMGDLGSKVESALQLRDDVERVLSLEGPVAALRSEAESLRGQIAEMSEGVGRIRAQHDDALRAHRHTTSRLEASIRSTRPRPAGWRRPSGGCRAWSARSTR
jgi:chromosome segregation ATPase